jgi:Arc/MetJ family transcription regulator
MSSFDARIDAHSRRSLPVRTTVNLDDALLDEAQRLTGIAERTALIHEGLRALIERESARRLSRLGGSEKSLRLPPRRRTG